MHHEVPVPRHLGFAALWARDPRSTWSGTPWRLREALRDRCRVTDIGIRLPRVVRAALKLGHLRLSSSGVNSSWDYSAITDRYIERSLKSGLADDLDAVLQIQDLANLPIPYFTYQDMSFGALKRLLGSGVELTHFPGLSPSNLERRYSRQLSIYQGASGVITMSRWLASQLELDGVPAAKIHVAHPGINSPVSTNRVDREPCRGPFRSRDEPRSLLFLGRDFRTKGGDLVIESLRLVRQRYRRDTRLVIAGPKRWPLPVPPPEGVVFLGEVTQARAAELIRDCDLVVMPSRFEGFGIVFAEALVAGRPCIARRAFAMPEIIADGRSGRLVGGDDPSFLAETISGTLDDEQLYTLVWQQREVAGAYWSWERAASDILRVIGGAFP